MAMKPVGGLNYIIYSTIGNSIDYANSRGADSIMVNGSVELGIGEHMNLNVSHIFERLSLEGERIYTANLLQTRFVYNFNVRTFVRAIFQYTDIARNTGLYLSPAEPKTKALFTQFLFSYKINPQTVLFVGYSDNQVGLKGIDMARTDRTFFLKLGYALVL
jgi:hypothetical protein